jgi:hypothetical protein
MTPESPLRADRGLSAHFKINNLRAVSVKKNEPRQIMIWQ